MVLWKYIITNPGRKKKQTFFTILCLSLSSLIVLADFALINGIKFGLKKGINDVLSGQMTVYSSDDQRMNILESQLKEQNPFEWDSIDKQRLQQQVPDAVVNGRVRIGSLISFGEETSYVNFHALEEEPLQKIDHMLTYLSGRMPEKDKEITISETVAKDLKCSVGDTVLLVAGNIHDYMSDAIGVVAGIFEERGLAVFLGYNGFMPLRDGCYLAEIPSGTALELVVNPVNGGDFTDKEAEAVRLYFAGFHPGLKLADWDQTVPLLHSIVKVWSGGGVITQIIFVAFSLIILVALISLIIRSRTKEFGTLLAIGFSRADVKRIVSAEYALLCCFSVLTGYIALQIALHMIGNSVSVGSLEMQSALMTDRLSLFVQAKDVIYVLCLFTLTTVLSALISVGKLRKKKIYSMING